MAVGALAGLAVDQVMARRPPREEGLISPSSAAATGCNRLPSSSSAANRSSPSSATPPPRARFTARIKRKMLPVCRSAAAVLGLVWGTGGAVGLILQLLG